MDSEQYRDLFDPPFRGTLFSSAFLREDIKQQELWKKLEVQEQQAQMMVLHETLKKAHEPNEDVTKQQLIVPILQMLGWNMLPEQDLGQGRDVVDYLLFESAEALTQAASEKNQGQRCTQALAFLEAKRWQLRLDRVGDEGTPSGQVLRYLRRMDAVTEGVRQWGILTNGEQWRLYWHGAQSRSEQFFELRLHEILEDEHWFKIFVLMFGPGAFAPDADGRSFHAVAVDEGKLYEQRVREDISDKVFADIFPFLARAIGESVAQNLQDLSTDTLAEIREVALIVLYRLLFVLYAEDRSLLPVNAKGYQDYSLRNIRNTIKQEMDRGKSFSQAQHRYWNTLQELFKAIDKGDQSIDLPAYNGGLFEAQHAPKLMERIALSDAVMARVIDTLSFEKDGKGRRRYINYRDMGVQQLGSVYERLLEQELVVAGENLRIRPNAFARKESGSYYTPDALVRLIVQRTLTPLIEDCKQGEGDPASKILELKVCDPAMGSGHFLVFTVDYIADQVLEAIEEATNGESSSPMTSEIDKAREAIRENARVAGWDLGNAETLDDRQMVRRMVLKRCIYGVDMNPMAVELAKVALWLHTFTLGAPLSFLDHHLCCGNSLFGLWAHDGLARAQKLGTPLLMHEAITKVNTATHHMDQIEHLFDATIEETRLSRQYFDDIQPLRAPLEGLLSFTLGVAWVRASLEAQKAKSAQKKAFEKASQDVFGGQHGEVLDVVSGEVTPAEPDVAEWVRRIRSAAKEEQFLHWQTAFPGVWRALHSKARHGGFDAVVGNPPWDKMEFQEVPWFAQRDEAIARTTIGADRKRMIAKLQKNNPKLWQQCQIAKARVDTTAHIVRKDKFYTQLNKGKLNLYQLFTERAFQLTKPNGMVGLLMPSGIAADKGAASFFKGVATQGRLRYLYDFENRRTRYKKPNFFPDVHSQFKFCVFVASRVPTAESTHCGFLLQSVQEIEDEERCFTMTAADFAQVNPNTGTAPIFRSRRTADLVKGIYDRLPVLIDHDKPNSWPLSYRQMFNMTTDSYLFRTAEELEQDGWTVAGGCYENPEGRWLPLYEGKMIEAYNHRWSSVTVNPDNLHQPGQPENAELAQLKNPHWQPTPRYWVLETNVDFPDKTQWVLAHRLITNATNARTMIATIIPRAGMGNSLPGLFFDDRATLIERAPLLLANLNALVLDFVAQTKVQGTNFNKYMLEQLPVVPPAQLEAQKFGPKSAATIIREAVLELCYTAHDMAPFARDMGYDGAPFPWNPDRRFHLRAKLDALFFLLYGITEQNDISYIYRTFPIVERQEWKAYNRYRSYTLCLNYMNALQAGQPDAKIKG